MRRNLLWCILGTQSRERRLRLGRSVQLPPCPLIPTPSQGPRRHQPHWRSGQYHKAAAGDFPLHHPKHPSLPRRLAPVGIYTCDHISICPSADGGPARRGPTARARTGFDPHSPEVTSFADGEPAKIHPGLQGPRSRFGQAQSKAQTHSCTQGMAGRRDPPGHSCCLGTGPTTHNPHISRGTPRAAGRCKNLGIQVAQAPACHARPTTHHPRDGGPASKALGRYRPDHSTSHRPATVVPKGQGLK
jgi:hypothetical protein